jgi:hypothetical protein
VSSAKATQEINVVASIAGSPHLSIEAVPSRAGLIEATSLSVNLHAKRASLLNLLDGTLRTSTGIKASAKCTGVSRSGVVVGEIDYLEWATLVGFIG